MPHWMLHWMQLPGAEAHPSMRQLLLLLNGTMMTNLAQSCSSQGLVHGRAVQSCY